MAIQLVCRDRFERRLLGGSLAFLALLIVAVLRFRPGPSESMPRAVHPRAAQGAQAPDGSLSANPRQLLLIAVHQ